tara:strand:+ start:468 stop:755 length:288 start_codon:yes stop_codon:yes gene_type:complete
MNKSDNGIKKIVDRVVIRKDPFNGVAKQWQADLYFKDGNVWFSWCSGYRSKKSLINYINSVRGEDILIVRAPYKESWDTNAKGDATYIRRSSHCG